jgi:hypothetical protein
MLASAVPEGRGLDAAGLFERDVRQEPALLNGCQTTTANGTPNSGLVGALISSCHPYDRQYDCEREHREPEEERSQAMKFGRVLDHGRTDSEEATTQRLAWIASDGTDDDQYQTGNNCGEDNTNSDELHCGPRSRDTADDALLRALRSMEVNTMRSRSEARRCAALRHVGGPPRDDRRPDGRSVGSREARLNDPACSSLAARLAGALGIARPQGRGIALVTGGVVRPAGSASHT